MSPCWIRQRAALGRGKENAAPCWTACPDAMSSSSVYCWPPTATRPFISGVKHTWVLPSSLADTSEKPEGSGSAVVVVANETPSPSPIV